MTRTIPALSALAVTFSLLVFALLQRGALPTAPVWTTSPPLVLDERAGTTIIGEYGLSSRDGASVSEWHVQVSRDGIFRDVVVDTKRSMGVYREWLAKARPAKGTLRRPLHFARAVRPCLPITFPRSPSATRSSNTVACEPSISTTRTFSG